MHPSGSTRWAPLATDVHTTTPARREACSSYTAPACPGVRGPI